MAKSVVYKRLAITRSQKDFSLTRYATLLAFVGVVVLFSIITPTFFTAPNIANILSQSAILALVAIGLSFVIAIGGMDLSIAVSYDAGALMTILALQSGFSLVPAILLGLSAGVLIGLFNGLFVVKTKVTPFLVTLGTLFIIESVEKIVTRGGESIYLSGVSETFRYLGQGSFLVITTADGSRIDFKFSLILVIIVAIVTHFLLKKSVFGRRLYSIGAQKEAALLSGVPVNRYIIYAFVISAVICAFAGIIGSSVLNSFTPVSGRYYLLDAIGAVFIGSTLQKQGFANIPGTLIGVLLFGVLANGLNLAGLNFYWQSVARGIAILSILILDSSLQKQKTTKVEKQPMFFKKGQSMTKEE
ncbi:ABC transporter permease [Bacillus sp. Marseille-P3661]|uniref:ABC transporter permease n=1 Tax=Bacillus sp. Marseille-P3661 TaxID=1936234 RepID=UPI000C841EA6|nr:ABC transporter permease [Bacillus sp. Marseille-P3661]